MTEPTNRSITNADERSMNADEPRMNADARRATRRRFTRREFLLLVVLSVCLCASAAVARWLEVRRPAPSDGAQSSEELYVSPTIARRLSLSFNGTVADWYWLRALQYVGRKAAAQEGRIQLDNLSALNLRLLAPLLDNATTLDPQFIAAYEYGAVVLPAVDTDAAIKLVNKGVAANPQAWRLRSYLGYIYWQQGRFKEASEAYAAAARVEGAPAWLSALAAQMSAKGGSRETARAIYETMLRTTDDEQMRRLAANRLAQLQSLDELDALRRVLSTLRERSDGRCPASWREVAPLLHAARFNQDAAGTPLDPSGVPYKLVNDRCDVELGEQSQVLRNY